jgi:sulfatase maturation enzyme AslB (radical SAM superfamily)
MGALQCGAFRYGVGEPDVPDECRSCESRAACQGGCPNDKLLLTGTRSGKSVVCEIHKEIIPRLRHLDEMKRARAQGIEKRSSK